MNNIASFYVNRVVLVTGHTGFKGSWMVAWLKELGAKVVGYALPPEPGRPSLFEDADLADGMTSVLGDIRHYDQLKALFDEHQPEIVFHMAAQPLVRRSYREPVDTYAVNVMGTVNVLEAIRSTPSVRAAVVITTDKVYRNSEWVWGYRENDPLGGNDPYSSSKACAELVTSAYVNSYFRVDGAPRVATARAGNVVGGGDWAEDRLIPDIVRAIWQHEPIIIRNPGATRPWQHVLEPLAGYLMLAQRLWEDDERFVDAWNFGPNRESGLSVSEVAHRLVSLWGAGEIVVRPDPEGPQEAHALQLDAIKAQTEMGWKPLLSVDETLEAIVAWYKGALANPTAAVDLLRGQLRDYMHRLPSSPPRFGTGNSVQEESR